VFAAKDSMSKEPLNIYAQFKLADLDPGTYLLRVEAQVSGSPAPPIGRETLITVSR
jgi:hypothetical protein